jgi:adenosylmethionine-8-amino-7-oxononanoate aminotransferase
MIFEQSALQHKRQTIPQAKRHREETAEVMRDARQRGAAHAIKYNMDRAGATGFRNPLMQKWMQEHLQSVPFVPH